MAGASKTLVGQWLVHRKPWLGSGWCIENVAGASKTLVGQWLTRVAVAGRRRQCWFSVAGNNPGRLKLTSCFNHV